LGHRGQAKQHDKGIFVLIGGFIAAIICAVIAGTKGRNPLGWVVINVIPSKKS
jgi:hypothetical protein